MALPNFGNNLFKALGIKYNIFDLNTVWYARASVKKATFCGVAFFFHEDFTERVGLLLPTLNFTFFITNCHSRVYALGKKFDIIVKIKME